MIDTIRLKIPLEGSQVKKVRKRLETYLRVDNETGEILHEFVRGPLKGSWDYKIHVALRDRVFKSEEKIIDKGYGIKEVKKVPVAVECDPYLICEFSLPKFRFGVNFFNTTIEEDMEIIKQFRIKLALAFDILPAKIDDWDIERVDVGENFKTEYDIIGVYKSRYYPRRKRFIYPSSVVWKGYTTLIKLYDKGKEFKVHDKQRLKEILGEKIKWVEEITQGIYRIEVEIKKNKLIKENVTMENLKEKVMKIYYLERKKIDNFEGKINKSEDVIRVLDNNKEKIKSISRDRLLAIWFYLSQHGLTETNKKFNRWAVYRARKIFKELGISLGFIKEEEFKSITIGNCIKESKKEMEDIRKKVEPTLKKLKVANF